MGKYFKGFLCAGDTKLDKKDNIFLCYLFAYSIFKLSKNK